MTIPRSRQGGVRQLLSDTRRHVRLILDSTKAHLEDDELPGFAVGDANDSVLGDLFTRFGLTPGEQGVICVGNGMLNTLGNGNAYEGARMLFEHLDEMAFEIT